MSAVPQTNSLADTLAMLRGTKNQFSRNAGRPVQLKEGKTKVRVLRSPTDPRFYREIGQHWIKPDEKAKAVAVCGSVSVILGETIKGADGIEKLRPDPVGQAVDMAIARASNDDEVKLYKSWRPRKFVLLIAIILDGPDAGPEPKFLQLSGGAFHDFLAIAETYAEQGADVFDVETGYDMVFERRGKMLDTEYTVMASARSRAIDKGLVARMPDFDSYIAKEYLRQGDDRKALTAISTIAGISVTALLGGGGAPGGAIAAPRPAGALTGPAARLADLAAPAPEPTPAAPPPAPVAASPVEDEDERELRLLQERMAKKKAAAAAAVAAPTPAPAAPAPAADGFGSAIDQDDLEATLAELDKLG